MKYTWGLDLSGTMHGAGGVGGLLGYADATGASNQYYWFTYDANGNVSEVLDYTTPSSITVAAHYEYDPYGQTITSNGPFATANPIRFSTKWLDTEQITPFPQGAIAQNGLYYYGYRYYSPTLGRWLNRDPIEESGGVDLYEFVHNNSTNNFDSRGLKTECSYHNIPGNTTVSWYPYRRWECKVKQVQLPIWPPGATVTIWVLVCDTLLSSSTPANSWCACDWVAKQKCNKICATPNGDGTYCFTESEVTVNCAYGPRTYGKVKWDPVAGWKCNCNPPTSVPKPCCGSQM